MTCKLISTPLFLLQYFGSVFTPQRPDQLCHPEPMSDFLLGVGGKGRSVTPITQFHLVLRLRMRGVVP
jgi:hypothetical protein